MGQKLVIRKDYSIEEIQGLVDQGAKFVVFQYCISLVFAVSLRRFSSVFFIEPNEDISQYKRKYNIYSYIFGWWCIPYGPWRTIESLNINKKGGLDVTEDVLLNLTESGLKNREVEIIKTNHLFEKPDKYEDRSFRKIGSKLKNDENIKIIVIGLFVNTEENVHPYNVIGISCSHDYNEGVMTVQKLLNKEFRRGAYFEFVDLDDSSEFNTLLKKQGSTYL